MGAWLLPFLHSPARPHGDRLEQLCDRSRHPSFASTRTRASTPGYAGIELPRAVCVDRDFRSISLLATGHAAAWCPHLPDDGDDTAIIALELAKAGRLRHDYIKRIVCKVLLPNRIFRLVPPHPRWIRRGAFQTWLGVEMNRPNIVDCCVNANVIALMAWADLMHIPGCAVACQTIKDGITGANGAPKRLATLTPF